MRQGIQVTIRYPEGDREAVERVLAKMQRDGFVKATRHDALLYLLQLGLKAARKQ